MNDDLHDVIRKVNDNFRRITSNVLKIGKDDVRIESKSTDSKINELGSDLRSEIAAEVSSIMESMDDIIDMVSSMPIIVTGSIHVTQSNKADSYSISIPGSSKYSDRNDPFVSIAPITGNNDVPPDIDIEMELVSITRKTGLNDSFTFSVRDSRTSFSPYVIEWSAIYTIDDM